MAHNGTALARLVRFGRILTDESPPVMQIVGDRVEFSFEPLPEQRVGMSRLADFDLAALLKVLRQITGLELVPLEVHLPYRAFRRWTDASPREYRDAKEDS